MSERRFLLVLQGRDAAGATTNFRYATHGHYTTAFGSGSSNWADARLRVIGSIEKHLYAQNTVSGANSVSGIVLQLHNSDGELDALESYGFDDSLAYLYEVDAGDAATEYAVLVIEQVVFTDENTISVAARGYRHLYDKPYLTTKYAGTNSGTPLAGVEGTADDIKGYEKPEVIGTVYNASPVLVNTSKLIYQMDGVRGFVSGYTLAVFDKRAAITRGADYVSQADMEATAPAAGTYRVWPSGGCFRLGTTPVGRVTVDMANPYNAGGGIFQVIQRVVDKTLVMTSTPGTVYNYLAANPTSGIYLTSEVSALQALQAALDGVVGSLFDGYRLDAADTTLAVILTQLADPAALAYTPVLDPIELDESTILPGTLKHVLQNDATRGLPVWRVNVNYKRNWTVMSETDLAGVALAEREIWTREWRTAKAEDAAVKTQWPGAMEVTFNSLIATEAAAQTEASRLLTLFKVNRQMFSLTVPGAAIRLQPQFTASGATVEPIFFQVGSIVNIAYPRYGLSAGKQFMVTGMRQNLDADTYDLTVWG